MALGFFDRMSRGWTLTKASLNVLRLDSEILLLPVISAVVLILLSAGILGGLVVSALAGHSPSALVVVLALALLYFASYFVVIFFNAATVAMAMLRFEGQNPKLADGLRASKENWVLIAQWAVVAATVGLILRALEQASERYGFLAEILVGSLEFAWGMLVYFVVPLLVYRKLSPMAAVRESGHLIRNTWGEAVGGWASMGIIFAGLGFVALILAVLVAMSAPFVVAVAVMVGFVVFALILAVVYSAAQGVLTAALYKYATTGQVPAGFDHAALA
jgi:hypothetical protein